MGREVFTIENIWYQIIYTISNVFATYTMYRLMRVFLGEPSREKGNVLVRYALYFLVDTLVYLVIDIALVNLVSKVACLFFLTLNYEKPLRKRILTVICLYMLLFCVETLVVLLTGFTGLSMSTPSQYRSIMGTICIQTAMFMAMLFLERFDGIKRKEKFPPVYWLCIFIVPASGLIIILQQLRTEYMGITSIIVSITIVLLVNFSVFYLYDALIKSMDLRTENRIMLWENRSYKRELDLMRVSQQSVGSVKHDLVNHIGALKVLIDGHQEQEAARYIDHLLEDVKEIQSFVNTGNVAVDSILNFKIEEAVQNGISVIRELTIPYDLKLKGYDMSAILGNLLDNAIRAVSALDKEERKIYLKLRYNRGRLMIMVKNRYKGEVKHTMDNTLKSTKSDPENHGIGLSNVQKIVEHYHGSMTIETGNQEFEVYIMMFTES